MPDDDIKLPEWYLQIEKVAGKLAAGCAAAEFVIAFWAKHILPDGVIATMHMFIFPFGILCIVLSGFKGLGVVTKAAEILKKLKE
jgi:hypothetical protein